MIYIGFALLLIFLLISFIVAQFIIPAPEKYYDYDWSTNWTDLDFKARIGADCKPITTIHRKIGRLSPWIWIVPDSCEQGLPHTRAVDIIAIPKNYPKNRLASTIDHEVIHLYQRLLPDSWSKFYRLKWHYEIYKESPVGMPNDLITMKRANPDTALAPWCCWMNRYWPVPVYTTRNDLSLSRAPVKWWNQDNNTISNEAPDEWLYFFGNHIHQVEHPHEISAEFLAGPLKNSKLPDNASQAMILLKKAWNEDNMYPNIDE